MATGPASPWWLALFLAQVGNLAVSPEALIGQELVKVRTAPETPARLGAESRLLFFAAEVAADGQRRAALHEQGLALADRALQLDPGEPSAMLWWSAHRGSQATPLDPFAAIRIAREVEQKLLGLKATHPDYDHSAADRALGRLYQVAPRGISVGSLGKAGEHLRAAVGRDPDFPGNALFYAQYLAAVKDCTGAREWAIRVLRSPALAAHPLERTGWIAEARKLLAGLPGRCPREESWP